MSIIRADSIKNRVGDGAPDFPNGITVTGIVTATTLNQNVTGDLDVDGHTNLDNVNIAGVTTFAGAINGSSAAFTGNVSVGGVLTYEDVKNVDAIGIITARAGIKMTGGSLYVGGNSNFTGTLTGTATTANTLSVANETSDAETFITFTPSATGSQSFKTNTGLKYNASNGALTATSFVGSGANLTGIDATSIKDSGGNVKVQAQASGAMYTGIHTFSSGAEVGSNIKLGNAGVITATSFVGDGSDLTNLPAGLGTALSATASNPLNKMYYTNQVLGVPSSVTVDVPASASKAYTQYADIKVDGSADLIIAEGDDLIPDVLGLADFGTFGGGASAGRIRVNSISNAANDGSPTVQKGLVITGVCTATSFSGSGANLTSLPAQATIANNADNRIITGGSGVNLNGESTLTYNGLQLNISNTVPELFLTDTNSNNSYGRVRGNGGNLVLSADVNNATGGSVMVFETDGSEKARIDDGGRLLIGTTVTDNRDGYNSSLQVAGTGGDDSSISIGRYSANASYPSLVLSKSRNAAINSHTRLNTNDYLGGIQFQGDDGTRFLVGASIVAQAASPVADYDMATDLIFSTNYGTTSPTKSMTLDQQGRLTKPNQPFVMVHINTTSNRQTTGSQLIIPWDTIHGNSTNSNVGSHFNTSNHRFTAPIDGRYFFCLSMNIVADNIMYHRINGTERSKAEYRIADNVWDHIDASFIYDMNANDYYETYSQLYTSNGQRWNGGGTTNSGWDTLSIYLLG